MKQLIVALLVCLTGISASFAAEKIKPLTDGDFRTYNPAQVRLGRLLFYDRVLSGNYVISCATCHNHRRASSNGFTLDAIPEEVKDELAINGLPLYDALKPSSRHSPPLFNLAAKQFQTLFMDGRLTRKADGSFEVYKVDELPAGLNDVLAVQSLIPVITDGEFMANMGNDPAQIAHIENQTLWDALAERVRDLPEYWPHFKEAFPEMKDPKEIDIVKIGNAIGAFVGTEWRSDNSPFDRYLRGDKSALTARQVRGMELFYGDAGCGSCHAGILQTDHQFHAIGGWPWRFDANFEDKLPEALRGRFSVTGRDVDRFKLRTQTLRNVALTAPYGHAGGYETLEEVIEQHLFPDRSYKRKLAAFERDGVELPRSMRRTYEEILASRDVPRPPLLDNPDDETVKDAIADLIAFLNSLTDEKGARGKLGRPEEVPSSLFVD